jgi:hypothetical protein
MAFFENPPEYAYAPMFLGSFWEFLNIVVWICMFTFSLKYHGKWPTLKIFGVGLIYGMVLENGGPLIIPQLGFEGFFWEETYNIYLFEFFGHGYRLSKVPLATHLGWTNVFFLGYCIYEKMAAAFPKIQEGKIKSILWGFIIMTMSGWMRDLQLDPIATRFRWWVWNEHLRPVWFGVPIVNYIAWFWAVGVFGAIYVAINTFTLQKYPELDKESLEPIRTKWLFYSLPIMWVVDVIGVMMTIAIVTSMGLMYI